MAMARALSIYKRVLEKHPLKMNAIQTALLTGTGDIIAQRFVEERIKHDWIRTSRMAFMGALIGPTIHTWYSILQNRFGKLSGFKAKLTMVSADQILFAPICIACFLTITAALEQKEPFKALEENYLDVLTMNYTIWPFVQVINFTYIPLQFRTLFIQTIALGWNTYLAWKIHSEVKISDTSMPLNVHTLKENN